MSKTFIPVGSLYSPTIYRNRQKVRKPISALFVTRFSLSISNFRPTFLDFRSSSRDCRFSFFVPRFSISRSSSLDFRFTFAVGVVVWWAGPARSFAHARLPTCMREREREREMARSTHPGLPSTKKVDDATSQLENAFDRSKTVFLEEAQSIIRSTLQSPIGISRRMASKQLESLLVSH